MSTYHALSAFRSTMVLILLMFNNSYLTHSMCMLQLDSLDALSVTSTRAGAHENRKDLVAQVEDVPTRSKASVAHRSLCTEEGQLHTYETSSLHITTDYL